MGIIKNFKENKNAKNEIKEKVRVFVMEGAKLKISIETQGLTGETKAKIDALMDKISNWIEEICRTHDGITGEEANKKCQLISEALQSISDAIDREAVYQKVDKENVEKTNAYFNDREARRTINPRDFAVLRESLRNEGEWSAIGLSRAQGKVVEAEAFCRKINKRSGKTASLAENGVEEQSRG